MTRDVRSRRRLVAGLGAAATAMAMGGGTSAQAPAAFAPARHPQDDWMDALPGKHRIVLDVTSPEAVPDGIRFAGNLFTGHKNGYGLDDREIAVILVLRHSATRFGYTDAMWSKYARAFAGSTDAAAPAPTTNPHNTGENPQLAGLAKRGVHVVICGSASLMLARRIAGADGDADAVSKELAAHVVPNGHVTMGVAGIVPVAHAQERGYSYVFVG